MTKVVVAPSELSGTITVPPSKSITQRALALALLHNGKTIIKNAGNSNDEKAAIRIIEQLSTRVDRKEDGSISVNSPGFPSNFKPPTSNLQPSTSNLQPATSNFQLSCGESGLAFRMFAPILAISENEVELTGEGSLLKRPMHFFDSVFPKLNVAIRSNEGFPPLAIRGPIVPENITIDGSSSSQYLTGLLFAFAKSAVKPVTITVKNLVSKPYIDISLDMLQYFGYDVCHKDYAEFYINPSSNLQSGVLQYSVEADWSSAAFLLVAGAILGNLSLNGLNEDSLQADKKITAVLNQCGSDINIHGKIITVNNKQDLKAFIFDATDCPDLFPPLAVLAAYCKGRSVISGVSRLQHKESNRAQNLQAMLSAMRIKVDVAGDDMIIEGGNLKGAVINADNDHRIVMAAVVAALGAEDSSTILDSGAADKSYPLFFEHLKSCGANIRLENQLIES
jgi:3-phosphoshikimate 1-carboxyvinyltransferase